MSELTNHETRFDLSIGKADAHTVFVVGRHEFRIGGFRTMAATPDKAKDGEWSGSSSR